MRYLVPALILAAAPALAGSQIERSVALGLAMEGIDADVESLSAEQVSALHLELSSQSDDPSEGDVRRRDALLAILAWSDR